MSCRDLLNTRLESGIDLRQHSDRGISNGRANTMDPAGGSLIGYVFGLFLVIVPLWKIFGRAGFSPAWALLIFVPFLGYITALLLLAFRRWPATEGRDKTT
jgi:hypothetical protein